MCYHKFHIFEACTLSYFSVRKENEAVWQASVPQKGRQWRRIIKTKRRDIKQRVQEVNLKI